MFKSHELNMKTGGMKSNIKPRGFHKDMLGLKNIIKLIMCHVVVFVPGSLNPM